MKKNKALVIIGVAALVCGIGTVAASFNIEGIKADTTQPTWVHYKGVAPSMDSDGSREYWINCANHEIYFFKPTGVADDEGNIPDIDALREIGDYRFIPRFNAGPGMIAFGAYPQSATTSEESQILDNVTNIGVFEMKFYNGNGYYKNSSNNIYYKVEPMMWRILDDSNPSDVLLLADKLFDYETYNISDYDNGNMQFGLDTGDVAGKLCLNVSNFVQKSYQSDVLQMDNLFCVNYDEMLCQKYGFSNTPDVSDSAKECLATDYAISRGVEVSEEEGYEGNCGYWTRTACGDGELKYVTYDGKVSSTSYSTSGIGLRPAIRLNTDNNEFNSTLHTTPTYKQDDPGTVLFGEYPQSKVEDSTLLTALDNLLPDVTGCVYYNNERYEKLGTDYYKYDPIEWRILEKNEGSASKLLAKYLIDCSVFGPNEDYASSWIRNFFTYDFPEKALKSACDLLNVEYLDDLSILDLIYLLSVDDYENETYGLNTSSSRCCRVTEYNDAKGPSSFVGYGEYWTRTPADTVNKPGYVNIVFSNGNIAGTGSSSDLISIRPVINIVLP